MKIATTLLLFIFNTIAWGSGSHHHRNINRNGLTQKQAMQRFNRLSNIHYRLHLTLNKTSSHFVGNEIVSFHWKPSTHPLLLDFRGGHIKKLSLNGQASNFTYHGKEVQLSSQHLRPGNNTLQIQYENAYTHDGSGLYRFKDHQDGAVYIYSQFQVFDANHMFPCFDQPDLKATFQLTVTAPADWLVISTMLPDHTDTEHKHKIWHFPRTPKISTYVFSLHAGDYVMWQDTAGKVPLRLFARKSLASKVNAKQWFQITRRGLQYFQRYFDYPYPFKKYDQLIVPNLKMAGMENVAAATFSEQYVPQSTPNADFKMSLNDIIFHELSHMWFGNLVTLKWWGDLWLNESYATFAANEANQHLDPNHYSRLGAFIYNRRRVYQADASVTTHPVIQTIKNTEKSEAIFDQITYGKGYAILKQLQFLIGQKRFKQAIQDYIHRYAYTNTTFLDFIKTFNRHTRENMKQYAANWFQTTGYNEISLKKHCNQGLLSSITLNQFNSPLRRHKTRLGLYANSNSYQSPIATLAVTYEGRHTTVDLSKRHLSCPDFISTNEGDLDYAQPRYSREQLQFLEHHLQLLPPLIKAHTIFSLYTLMKQSKSLTPISINSIFIKQIAVEQNRLLLKMLLGMQRASLAYFPTRLDRMRRKIENTTTRILWSRLNNPKTIDAIRPLLFDYYMQSNSPKQISNLKKILSQKIQLPHFKLTRNIKWKIIAKFVQGNVAGGLKLAQNELNKKRTYYNNNIYLSILASQPSIANKKKWLKVITSRDSKYDLTQKEFIMNGLFPDSQNALKTQLLHTIASSYIKLAKSQSNRLAIAFASAVKPTACTLSSANIITKLLQNPEMNNPSVRKKLTQDKEWVQQCLKIQNFMNASRSRR